LHYQKPFAICLFHTAIVILKDGRIAMKQNTVIRFVYMLSLGVLMVSCGGVTHTELKGTRVDKARRGKPVSSILVIGATNEDAVRRTYEKKFVQQLKAMGVEAVSSADVIAIPADQKLDKAAILKAVNEFGNDAVMITHVDYTGEKDVALPARQSYQDFFRDYSDAYDQSRGQGRYSTLNLVRLKTNLYDVKTEKPLWSGRSQTWNPRSDDHIMNEAIKVVVDSLHKNKLLPQK
jgi:hypothetical protein